MRRRLGALCSLVLVLGLTGALHASEGSAAVQPSRAHISLEKLCPKNDLNVQLRMENVSDDGLAAGVTPQPITVRITKSGTSQTWQLYQGTDLQLDADPNTVSIAAGTAVIVRITGPDPVAWAGVYKAEFSAHYKGNPNHAFTVKQFCRCENSVVEPPDEDPPLPDP